MPQDLRNPQEARQNVSDYSEMFYNPKHRYSMSQRLSKIAKISEVIYAKPQYLLSVKVEWI
jgi:hypothetical protein